jgi:Holliday junction resolvase RusA-like endonuclease
MSKLYKITFAVDGVPVPKQSFRYARRGGYTSPRVRAWQELVAWHARAVMAGKRQMLRRVSARMVFFLPTNRRVDVDNLIKCVQDACNGIVYADDCIVCEQQAAKYVCSSPGVLVTFVQQEQPTDWVLEAIDQWARLHRAEGGA